LVALVSALGATVAGAPAAHADDASSVNAYVLDSLGRSTATAIAAQVNIEGHGNVVFLRHDLALQPASTQKLYTTGAALLGLGLDHRLRTELRENGPRIGTLLLGDLVFRGSGDPTLTDVNFRGFAGAVAASGIRRVYGDIWMDDTLFDRTRVAPGWKAGWMPRYVGPLSGVSVNSNAYRSDSAFLAEPAIGAGERLRDALALSGVSVRGEIKVGPSPKPVRALLAHHETPVPVIARKVLKVSDNFAAEQLLKVLGSQIGSGTTNGGIEFVNLLSERTGLARIAAADGSGLSSLNRSSVGHQTEWLVRLARTPVGETLRASLPVACVDGTLHRRMCGTPAAGKVFAKTGYVAGVVALSGYTTTANGKRVTFSFLLNGVNNVDAARDAIDRAVVHLASVTI
ncbi:MAG: D-alanyl-D-alanine carboxypeptidase/D-alanyl-D-alanine-endopeptidase, partial [Acidimicrobiia bacterium]